MTDSDQSKETALPPIRGYRETVLHTALRAIRPNGMPLPEAIWLAKRGSAGPSIATEALRATATIDWNRMPLMDRIEAAANFLVTRPKVMSVEWDFIIDARAAICEFGSHAIIWDAGVAAEADARKASEIFRYAPDRMTEFAAEANRLRTLQVFRAACADGNYSGAEIVAKLAHEVASVPVSIATQWLDQLIVFQRGQVRAYIPDLRETIHAVEELMLDDERNVHGDPD